MVGRVKAARNFLVIALLAAVVAFAPGGGNAFQALMTVLMMGFLAAIVWTVGRFVSRNELTMDSLTDRQRLLLYGAAAVMVLLIAGSERLFQTGPGTLAWVLLLVGSVLVAWRVWRETSSY